MEGKGNERILGMPGMKEENISINKRQFCRINLSNDASQVKEHV